jgi:hypothetical protein
MPLGTGKRYQPMNSKIPAQRHSDRYGHEAQESEQNSREMYDQMARIAITPHWVRYYDFGAGRLPRFLQELAERNRS